MKILSGISQWQALKSELKPGSLGLVPTMGALHDGHLSLVERCIEQNEISIVSIFVNPTQFDLDTDLASYPRDQQQDLELLRARGVDGVFVPDYETLYPDQFRYRLFENELSQRFCGKHRPGHFDGVLTVVMKLFNIIRPDRAYFGEKDYQQLQLIKGMCEAFFIPVDIIACPVVREADGLAMSSRNRLLNPEQRRKAAMLYECLRNSRDIHSTKMRLQENGFQLDYIEDWKGRRLVAAQLGSTRLIDNVRIK